MGLPLNLPIVDEPDLDNDGRALEEEEERDGVDKVGVDRGLFWGVRSSGALGGPYRPVRLFMQKKHRLQLQGTNCF